MSTKIYVKTLDGKTFAVDIDEKTSVADLKMILQVKTGVESKLQKIVYLGVTLDDKALLISGYKKVSSIPIEDGSTMQMYQRSLPATASLFGGSGAENTGGPLSDDTSVDASELKTQTKK